MDLQQAFTQSLQNNKGRAKTKFRNDYDFEEANKKFENMCLKSDNVKVGEEAIATQVFYDFFDFILLLLPFIVSKYLRNGWPSDVYFFYGLCESNLKDLLRLRRKYLLKLCTKTRNVRTSHIS